MLQQLPENIIHYRLPLFRQPLDIAIGNLAQIFRGLALNQVAAKVGDFGKLTICVRKGLLVRRKCLANVLELAGQCSELRVGLGNVKGLKVFGPVDLVMMMINLRCDKVQFYGVSFLFLSAGSPCCNFSHIPQQYNPSRPTRRHGFDNDPSP